MTQQAPVGDIRRPDDGVKYIEYPLPGPGTLPGPCIMRVWTSDSSEWVHSSFVICIPPEIKTHFIIALRTPKEEIIITMSPSSNVTARLVSINYDLATQPRTTYCNLFQSYSY